jgi:hypothetical protein
VWPISNWPTTRRCRQIQRIELNPFSLEVTLWGLVIGEPGKEQIGFERLYADLQIDSLWTKALHLANIELDKPKTEILFAKDGKLNLLGLFKCRPVSRRRPIQRQALPAAHRQHQTRRWRRAL